MEKCTLQNVGRASVYNFIDMLISFYHFSEFEFPPIEEVIRNRERKSERLGDSSILSDSSKRYSIIACYLY